MIICKFGGSATTNTQALENIKTLTATLERKVFVFSALGKDKNGIKLTDLLINLHKSKNKECLFSEFFTRIKALCEQTKVEYPERELTRIKIKYLKTQNKNFLISRGEYLTAKIMAQYLKIPFVPAEKLIYFNKHKLDKHKTKQKIRQKLIKYGRIVVPGFYGIDENKKIVLFSRGGGDTTGAIISSLLNAETYENYTDVDGLFEINPQFCPSKQIKTTNYKTLCFLTQFDCSVINHQCAEILKDGLTTLKIKNIFNLKATGTTVKKSCSCKTNFVVFRRIKDEYLLIKKDRKMFYLTFCKQNALKQSINKLKRINSCVR